MGSAMCDAVFVSLQDLGSGAWNRVGPICTEVIETYDAIGREVARLAYDYISPKIAPIARKIFNALPFTLPLLMLPHSITAFPIFTLLLVGVIAPVVDDLIGKETRKSVYRGISDAEFISASIALAMLCHSCDVTHVYLVASRIFCSIAAYLFSEVS